MLGTRPGFGRKKVTRIGVIDFPLEGTLVAKEGFICQGFAFHAKMGAFSQVVVRHEGIEIGSTTLRHIRLDLHIALPQVWDVTCGYRIMATIPPEYSGLQTIKICAIFKNGDSWEEERHVLVGEADYRAGDYGALLREDVTKIFRRDEIYCVGPPSAQANPDCLDLLKSYMVEGENVLDVGCGVGAYGPPLREVRIAWHGCDVNSRFVAALQERALPVTHVTGERLPFADNAFETLMCVEVLEHIEAYDRFLAEIARVAAKQALFSVPNAGAIPVLADQLVVPWHMLEADHKNFFSVSGLKAVLKRHFRHVEIVPYGQIPVPSSNGSPVFYHLFAVAQT